MARWGCSLALVGHIGAQADSLQGRVVSVADGDTVTVLDDRQVQHKIRLSGIDAPEKSQPYGQRAKERLSDWVFGQRVEVDFRKTDRYGRLVGKIVFQGQDINLAQVQAGLAWHYKDYQREQPPDDRVGYAQAEDLARMQRKGLWQDPRPVPAWEFRLAKRQQHAASSCSQLDSCRAQIESCSRMICSRAIAFEGKRIVLSVNVTPA